MWKFKKSTFQVSHASNKHKAFAGSLILKALKTEMILPLGVFETVCREISFFVANVESKLIVRDLNYL